MTELEQLERDLGFVRAAVRRGDVVRAPATIYFLWAGIVLIGFALVDLNPHRVGLYWTIVGPAGWLVSAYLGWAHGRRLGQQDREIGLRHALHWAAILVAIFLAALLPLKGMLRWEAFAPAVLLIISLSYVLAGLHLERPMLWVGLLMAAGYVAVLFVPFYAWTTLGVVVAAALIAAGLLSDHAYGTTAH